MLLGIDFGTSNSAIAEYFPSKGRTEVCKTDDGRDVLPTIIFVDGNGNHKHGDEAYLSAILHSGNNCASEFKAELGTNWKYSFQNSGESLSAKECCTEIINVLVRQAKQVSPDCEITGTVLTVPVANALKRDATREAALAANLKKVYLIEEPIAAAIESATENTYEKGDTVLVYDLGGGTFDFTLIQVTSSNEFDILATKGVAQCGGKLFDRLVLREIVAPWIRENFNVPPDFLNVQAHKKYEDLYFLAQYQAEKAKIRLSVTTEEMISVAHTDLGNLIDNSGKAMEVRVPLTRAAYDGLIEQEIAKTIDVVTSELKKKRKGCSSIDHVVFVGGPTKTPIVREMVLSKFPNSSRTRVDPMTVVARGAARRCESIDWDKNEHALIVAKAKVLKAGDVEYEFADRTSEEFAPVYFQSKSESENTVEIRTHDGWWSGKHALVDDLIISVPLEFGENQIEILVTNADHTVTQIDGEIYREAPAPKESSQTVTVAIKVRHDDGRYLDNVLDALTKKGERLPTRRRTKEYVVARDIRSEEDALTIELYQQEEEKNTVPGEPNSYLGCLKISPKLAKQQSIRSGSTVRVGFRVDEGHQIFIELFVDGVEKKLNDSFLIKDELTFEGPAGLLSVKLMIQECEREIQSAAELAVTKTDNAKLEKFRQNVSSLKTGLSNVSLDGRNLRDFVRQVREIRQGVFSFTNTDAKLARKMKRDADRVARNFDSKYRSEVDTNIAQEFDSHYSACLEQLENPSESGRRNANRILNNMDWICIRAHWNRPGVAIREFKECRERREMAIDKVEFDNDIIEGERLLAQNRIEELRDLIWKIRRNRVGAFADIEK